MNEKLKNNNECVFDWLTVSLRSRDTAPSFNASVLPTITHSVVLWKRHSFLSYRHTEQPTKQSYNLII